MSEHLGGAIESGDSNTIMPDVWGYLLVKYELKSVLDIGCGFGHTMKWFAENGLCTVLGIEGWQEALDRNLMKTANNAYLVNHDFTKGPATVCTPFDLVWSAEFLEHVEARYLDNIMQSFRLGRHACITHAEPGQGGSHHVNCQSTDYWIKVFNKWGFIYDSEETALLRRTDRWRATWGRRTLTMFHRT